MSIPDARHRTRYRIDYDDDRPLAPLEILTPRAFAAGSKAYFRKTTFRRSGQGGRTSGALSAVHQGFPGVALIHGSSTYPATTQIISATKTARAETINARFHMV